MVGLADFEFVEDFLCGHRFILPSRMPNLKQDNRGGVTAKSRRPGPEVVADPHVIE
jgi:hypothetical protein